MAKSGRISRSGDRRVSRTIRRMVAPPRRRRIRTCGNRAPAAESGPSITRGSLLRLRRGPPLPDCPHERPTCPRRVRRPQRRARDRGRPPRGGLAGARGGAHPRRPSTPCARPTRRWSPCAATRATTRWWPRRSARAERDLGGLDLVVNATTSVPRDHSFGGGPLDRGAARAPRRRGWPASCRPRGPSCAAAARPSSARGAGTLIQVSGGSARRAPCPAAAPGPPPSSAARALTHALALELRPRGVHVALLVADGIIQTERNPMEGRPPEESLTRRGRRGRRRLPGRADAARRGPTSWSSPPPATPGSPSRASPPPAARRPAAGNGGGRRRGAGPPGAGRGGGRRPGPRSPPPRRSARRASRCAPGGAWPPRRAAAGRRRSARGRWPPGSGGRSCAAGSPERRAHLVHRPRHRRALGDPALHVGDRRVPVTGRRVEDGVGRQAVHVPLEGEEARRRLGAWWRPRGGPPGRAPGRARTRTRPSSPAPAARRSPPAPSRG